MESDVISTLVSIGLAIAVLFFVIGFVACALFSVNKCVGCETKVRLSNHTEMEDEY